MAEVDSARTLKLWLVAATVLFFAFFAWITLFRAGPYGPPGHQWGSPAHRTDFTVYRGRRCCACTVTAKTLYIIRNVRGWAYVYPPPVFNREWCQFALLSLPVSVLAWYFVCCGADGLSAVFMSGRLAGNADSMSEHKKLAVTLNSRFDRGPKFRLRLDGRGARPPC